MPSLNDAGDNIISDNEMLTRLCEAILTNLMVFDSAGIPRDRIKQLVARDGVSLVGGGVELQIPISPTLTEETGRKLFETYSALLEDYDSGRIQPARLRLIQERNDFDGKVAAVKQSKSKLN